MGDIVKDIEFFKNIWGFYSLDLRLVRAPKPSLCQFQNCWKFKKKTQKNSSKFPYASPKFCPHFLKETTHIKLFIYIFYIHTFSQQILNYFYKVQIQWIAVNKFIFISLADWLNVRLKPYELATKSLHLVNVSLECSA